MNEAKFWLNRAVDEIETAHPEGEVIVSSGISPSGTYHVGHLRELLTVDALVWGLTQRGRHAKHLHFVDDLDALRKVPKNVPDEYEKYIGMPYHLVPAPDGSDKSYADFFFDEFKSAADELGVTMEVIRAHEQYQKGMFSDAITKTLEQSSRAADLIFEVSGRQLKRDWVPVQILDDDNRIGVRKFVGFVSEKQTVQFEENGGVGGEVTYANGRVKLDWRLDWPARWSIWGVDVEPFGRDHATKGGSYDTGRVLVKEIFGAEAPTPFPYEFINLKGETKKMSASQGTGLTPSEMLEIMPPQLLRYFILKNRPALTLYLDLGRDFGKLFDEYQALEHSVLAGEDNEYKMAYDLSQANVDTTKLPELPYALISTYVQKTHGETERVIEEFKKDADFAIEFPEPNIDELRSVIKYNQAWLSKWAPEEVRFEIQNKLPAIEINENEVDFLNELAKRIESAESTADGEWFHTQIYESREGNTVEPKRAFQIIYQLLLSKDSGPKAGWFLSTMDRQWLIKRLRREQ